MVWAAWDEVNGGGWAELDMAWDRGVAWLRAVRSRTSTRVGTLRGTRHRYRSDDPVPAVASQLLCQPSASPSSCSSSRPSLARRA